MDKLIKKFKEFNSTPYGTLITVSWVVLLVCLVIKLFGGNWFELWWENEKFISFCNYVDETRWLKITIASIIAIVTTYPIMCLILNKSKLTLLDYWYIPIIVIKSILGWSYPIISIISDFLMMIIIPILITKNWKRPIIVNIIVFITQVLLLLIRNIGGFLIDANSFIEQSLIQIDYYIMLILFYLYNFKTKFKKKGGD